MKPIGKTFAHELYALGLTGLPFGWTADGLITFDPAMPEDKKADVLAAYDAHDPSAELPVIAPSVSPRQIRQALTATGLRDQVEYAVTQGTQDLKDCYEYSTEFERDNAQVTAMGQALGVSDAQLDDLWALAATL